MLLFSLLLGLVALFLEQDEKINKIKAERTQYAEKLRINEKKLEDLMATLSRSDLGEIKKELVRLKEQEEKLAILIERLNLNKNAPVHAQLDILVERVTKLNEVSKKLEAAGFPPEPKDLKKALDRIKDAQSEITAADKALREALEKNKQLAQNLEKVEQGIAQKDGQIAKMKRTLGKGTEKPACWADEKTGKSKYIYNAGLTSRGIVIRHSATPPWAKARKLPINSIPYEKTMNPRKFRLAANPMFEWSEENECRFFVRAYDLTGPAEKMIYKRHMRFLQTRFYTYEDLDGHWE